MVKDSEEYATVHVSQKKLEELTGYTKNVITRGVKDLLNRQFICLQEHRKKRGEFGANEYTLCNPSDGEPLTAYKDAIFGNRLPYFTFPSCIISEKTAHWSLSRLSASELKLYVALLSLANAARNNEFQTTLAELCTVGDLAPATCRKAMDAIEERGLVWITGLGKQRTFYLCDPYTGQPLHEPDGVDENDPANYYVKGDKGQDKRWNLNTGNAEEIERLIRSCLPLDESPIVRGNGDLMIRCPFHDDHNPSCSVSPEKNGCFHCFGCKQSGSLITLLMQLRSISKAIAIQQIADATGVNIKYQQPDTKALAKYSYRNEKGKLLKQVLRFPNADGKKVFQQRRPVKGGWAWNTDGLPPMLYNMEWLKIAGTVCITEGEKDAHNITELHLNSQGGLVIGMTSGSADSWDAQLAKSLRGRRVILMPDADSAGEKFAADVKASLEAEGIEFRTVTFEDAGAKDVTDYLAEHTVEELVRCLGVDWIQMPDGKQLVDDSPPFALISSAETQLEDQITI
jgi:5S rRNA maturation endonuclease (ribonuclease M5)